MSIKKLSPCISKPMSDGALSILAAAKELFAELGFAGVSLSDIATHSGVSKANIFHHFTSKEELYLAVLKSACNESTSIIDQINDQSYSFVERFNFLVKSHLEYLLSHQQITRLLWRELKEDHSSMGKKLAEKVFGESFSVLADLLIEGQNSGHLRSDLDVHMLATLIVGCNVFFFDMQPVLARLPNADFANDPKEYSEKILGVLLTGIWAK